MEWNTENQLKRVALNGNEAARFSYDPNGRRVEKVAGGVTTGYLYDGEDLLRELRGAATFKYVHGPGIDEPLAREESAGTLSYYHADALGSIVKRTSQAGTVVHEYRYDAWGKIEAGVTEAGNGFTGREWDPETSLYYYRARYYDPSAGAFLSEDAATDFGVRAYAQNSPTDLVDPSGYAADLNLFNKTKYPYEWDVAANYMSSIEGYFVVAAHGNATAVLDDHLQWLNPSQLAERIRKEGWKKCQKVFVFACNLGRATYAKQLAQELGVEVRAPNGYIRFKKEYVPWGVSPEGDTVYVTFTP